MFNHKVAIYEYEVGYGACKIPMVALYDERDFSPETIAKIIRLYSSYKGVVMLTKESYEQVFRSLINA
jgi:hypothetical protein